MPPTGIRTEFQDMSFDPKSVLLAALVALAPTLCAHAADLRGYDPAPAPDFEAVPGFNWNGAYAGIHGGLVSPKVNPLADGKALSGGVQGGYLMQFGSAVVGAEAEASWLGSAKARVPGGEVKEKWRGAVKARAGVALDRTLVYGTAGLAMTKFDGAGAVSTSDGWKKGYLLGGGVEQSFGGGLSARVEYNYVTTDDVTSTVGGTRSRTDVTDHTIKAGLNYRF